MSAGGAYLRPRVAQPDLRRLLVVPYGWPPSPTPSQRILGLAALACTGVTYPAAGRRRPRRDRDEF